MPTPQGGILTGEGVVIDDTHDMVYEPCLFLECSKCLLSVQFNADELADECTEDIHELNNARITSQELHAS